MPEGDFLTVLNNKPPLGGRGEKKEILIKILALSTLFNFENN
jgi:hypothetical protein